MGPATLASTVKKPVRSPTKARTLEGEAICFLRMLISDGSFVDVEENE